MNAVVLLSGGLDSTTVLAIAQHEGYDVRTLSFRYGQRHDHEVQAARRIAQAAGVTRHEIVEIDLRAFGGSALTDDIAVPKGREIGEDIPVTYVPARNTIFLSFALAYAEVNDAEAIFIGVNALDYSGYPDCRPEYIAAFQAMADLATARGGIAIHAPLIDMTKAQIIARGLELGVDYGMTTSCYDPAPDGRPCGECDACRLRLAGFAANGLADPVA
jgi:7-cyano-7-deazaguanine synthase